MKKVIEFDNSDNAIADALDKSSRATFRNLTFKEDYRYCPIRFRQGLTWLRFLPRIKGSQHRWMMTAEIYENMAGISFTSPKTFDINAPSIFEDARNWFKNRHPEALYSKDNNDKGLKLYAKKVGLAWVVDETAPEGERLRIFNKSLYNGGRGGTTGLAYNILHEASSKDNEPNSPTVGQLIHGDITDPSQGKLVKVDRMATSSGEYASYRIGVGKNPAPLDHFMSLLTEDEHNLITPIEKTLFVPEEEEQKEILRRYIGDVYFDQMYSNITAATPHKESF